MAPSSIWHPERTSTSSPTLAKRVTITMPTMERVLVCTPDAATATSSSPPNETDTNKNAPIRYDDDDDSDDEIGRAIYNSSETAKARTEAANANNNCNSTLSSYSLHTSGTIDDSTSGTKRKSDLVQDKKKKDKQKQKRKVHNMKYTCSHEGCTNHVVKGGVCRRHGVNKC